MAVPLQERIPETATGDGLADAVRRLRARGEARLPYAPRFLPLAPAGGGAAWAVDGSHAVLVDNGVSWVVATRAEAIRWPEPAATPAPVRFHAAGPEDAAGQIAAAHDARGLEAPERVASAESFAQAWRALGEHDAAMAALASMSAGDLLLVDGALHGLGEQTAVAMADRVVAAARRRGASVVGVAKRSGLSAAGVPLVPLVARAGQERTDAWASPVPDMAGVFVARLHAAAPFTFRVDVATADMEEEALGRLLPLCRDAVYTGYPYPLALVHNRVAITAAEQAALRQEVLDAVRVAGGAAAWDLLQDFHDVLDRNVP